jgi:RpiR family carbohydrate utilization transcriptional regulator
VPTVAYTDPAIHAIAAALLREGDALVAISQRGNNPSLTRSAKLARRGGAEVIVLAPSGTPLADMASLLIPIDLVFATDPYTPISARLAYLVVIDVLAVGLALQRGPEFRKKMQNAQKALQEFDLQFDSFIG